MTGICIVSFDCEAKWGMADHITENLSRDLTQKNLAKAYKDALGVLSSRRISATFGFVGAMTLASDYFLQSWLPRLKASPAHSTWLTRLYQDIDNREFEGWFHPELLEMVIASDTEHEIASHGFTHLPFIDLNKSALILELEGIRNWMEIKQLSVDTLIYPRNLVAHKSSLSSVGIRGYRDRPSGHSISGLPGRLLNLASEFNPFPKSQPVLTDSGYPVSIPGGFFLNWRSSLRRLVPIALTVRRFQNALNDAFSKNGVVHLWLHPHNLINGRDQNIFFTKCMDVLGSEVANGRVTVMTQSQYVRAVARSPLNT